MVTVSLLVPTVVPVNGGKTVQSPAVPVSANVSVECVPDPIRFQVEPPSTERHMRQPALEDDPDAVFVSAVSPEMSACAFAWLGTDRHGVIAPSAVSPPAPSVTVIAYSGVPASSVPAV